MTNALRTLARRILDALTIAMATLVVTALLIVVAVMVTPYAQASEPGFIHDPASVLATYDTPCGVATVVDDEFEAFLASYEEYATTDGQALPMPTIVSTPDGYPLTATYVLPCGVLTVYPIDLSWWFSAYTSEPVLYV